MAETPTKIQPPPREPLPAIYPIGLIEVACRALAALIQMQPISKDWTPRAKNNVEECAGIAFRIIRDGLASHELAAKEGRSRG